MKTWLTLLILLSSCSVVAEERIIRFHSDIEVATSGDIRVTETIVVQAEGVQIRRGIYRDFPTRYPGPWLTEKQVGFEVLAVQRNGLDEPFGVEPRHNGMRVYIGTATQYLSLGEHVYTLIYQTNQQLGYFADHDELYWNVTGNGWALPIEQASAHVRLPGEGVARITDQQAWTGYQGESEQHASFSNTQTYLGFVTTRPLSAYQGLTIGIQLPKGILNPEPFDLAGFLSANLVWLLTVVVLLGYVGFYLGAWYRYGRDPEPGVITARYHPPKGLSPAAVHYIDNSGADDRTLTAALVSLAAKGYLQITQLQKQYRLKKLEPDDKPGLSVGEQRVRNRLFAGRKKELTISKQYNSYLAAARGQLHSALKKEYHARCFVDNGGYLLGAWLISLVAFFMVTLLTFSATMTAFDLLVSMIGFVVLTLITAASWVSAPIIMSMLILGVLIGGFEDYMAFIMQHLSWVLFTLMVLILNLLFAYLMRAPTPFGRHIKDQIDGLRLYMKAAEEHRLNALNPPDRSIEHYAALLPYAVALNLEHRWAEQFADVLSQHSAPDQAHQPAWYSNQSGGDLDFDVSQLTRSLNRNMRAATIKPVSSSSPSSLSVSSSRSSSSSSSYSSGGSGSSGGGGGGGGGGGW